MSKPKIQDLEVVILVRSSQAEVGDLHDIQKVIATSFDNMRDVLDLAVISSHFEVTTTKNKKLSSAKIVYQTT